MLPSPYQYTKLSRICAHIHTIAHIGISITSHVKTEYYQPWYQYTKLLHIFMVMFNIIIDVYSQLCTKVNVLMKTCIFTWKNSWNYTSIIIHAYLNTIYDM